MAAETVRSLYSRYMLWVPDLESYLSQMPKFLILSGFLSPISSRDTISPVVFLNLENDDSMFKKSLTHYNTNLVVLLIKVETIVIGEECSDLLSVLVQLDSHALLGTGWFIHGGF